RSQNKRDSAIREAISSLAGTLQQAAYPPVPTRHRSVLARVATARAGARDVARSLVRPVLSGRPSGTTVHAEPTRQAAPRSPRGRVTPRVWDDQLGVHGQPEHQP